MCIHTASVDSIHAAARQPSSHQPALFRPLRAALLTDIRGNLFHIHTFAPLPHLGSISRRGRGAPSLSVKDSFISRLEFKEIRLKYEQPVLRFQPVLCVVHSAGDDFALMSNACCA